METFLKEVAQQLREEHPRDLDKVTVVFNNRRSGLFLQRQFLQMDGAFFLPHIIGIDQLVTELGGLEIVPNEFLLFELFDIHKHLGGQGQASTSFEEFIPFGEIMLSDFTEIDHYQADAKQLFDNLRNLKSIGLWDIESPHMTPFQEKYLEFYHSLYQYYDQLHQRLARQHKAYSGMAYRWVAENIDSLAKETACSNIYFVGFNALSACEKSIIQYYVRLGIGRLITDGDAYYFDDERQEAGYFLRKLKKDFPNIGGYKEHFALDNKDITITKCPENILQCKYAGQILANQMQKESDNLIEQTAVVLADEKLLLPVLNALPAGVKTANVTMGFPFTQTAVHSMTLKLLSLHQRRKEGLFYHQDICNLLSDYCIAKLLGTENSHSQLTAAMVDEHIIYANNGMVRMLCQKIGGTPDLIDLLFTEEELTPTTWLDMIRKLTEHLSCNNALECNRKEQEALACLIQIIDYFENLQKQYQFINDISVLTKIYTRLAQRRSVAFFGKPLQGLQVLGMLETRNLDFKKVILLSANEGIIPSGRSSNTLIPLSLKKAFGIPTYREKDAVYAYNFYRLLQRADEVHILVNTESNGMGKGEPSRFVLQLEQELLARYPQQITLNKEILSTSGQTQQPTTISQVVKDDAILLRLKKLAENGFSPSALNQYRGCPMKFYYEYILSLRENDDINDDLAQDEVGSIIHKVLETIYHINDERPVPIKPKILDDALSNLDKLLTDALSDKYQHGRSHEGRNHFFESVAKSQLTHFLNEEKRRLQEGENLSIVGTEKDIDFSIEIKGNAHFSSAKIHGIIDRIDICNDHLRIIDYKTGKVVSKDLSVSESEPDLMTVTDQWFQVMLYAWIYYRKENPTLPLQSGIFPLRNLGSKLLHVSWDGADIVTPKHVETFETQLQQLVGDLLNPKIPFIAKPKSKLCKVCPFAETCKQSS